VACRYCIDQPAPDLAKFHLLEIQHFFQVYKTLERGKSVAIEGQGWAGRTDAEEEIRRAYERAGTPQPAT